MRIHVIMILLISFVSMHCGHKARFVPFESRPIELISMDDLETFPPFRATGRVFAIREDIRYRARWAFASSRGMLRIQAFRHDGGMFADITTVKDSVWVLIPSSRECHRGPLNRVPLADLLGVEIDWNAACSGLWSILYPHRTASGTWAPGSMYGYDGWMHSSNRLFVAPDRVRNLATFISVGDKDDRILVEVEAFEITDTHTLPSKLVFSWPKADTKLWIDIERISIDSTGVSLPDPCRRGSNPYTW